MADADKKTLTGSRVNFTDGNGEGTIIASFVRKSGETLYVVEFDPHAYATRGQLEMVAAKHIPPALIIPA